MREIIFRGKSIYTKVWIYGYLTSKDCIEEVEVIPETIGQFTGLTDKNGVKIFEGDYILVPYNFIGKQEVQYLNEKGRYNISNYALDKITVIGNIHE